MSHRAGFVNILGRPNVGKSTLLNALMGERLVIATSKPQTTRHRIFGIYNEDDYQIVFSDTPGIITEPKYNMQKVMNRWAFSVFEDADLLLLMVDIYEDPGLDDQLEGKMRKLKDVPIHLLINKVDQAKEGQAEQLHQAWSEVFDFDKVQLISALHEDGVSDVHEDIIECLPESPPYFPKDELSDRPMRFFISEMIREKILEQYSKEVPYSCQVVIENFKQEEKDGKQFTRIEAIIYVNRKTQKAIIIGKGGQAIKKLGIASRESIQEFLGHQIFLQLYVKVRDGWRDDETKLRRFGYS